MSWSGGRSEGDGRKGRFGLVQIWNEGESLTRISQKEMIRHFGTQAVQSMAKSPMTSIFSVLTIAVALFLLGAFLMTLENVGDLLQGTRSEVRVRLFLNDGVSQEDRDQLVASVRDFRSVEAIGLIDKAAALAEFGEALGDEAYLLKGLESDNPLPESLEIKFALGEATGNLFEEFAAQYSSHPAVERVSYSRGVVGQLGTLLSYFRVAGSFGVFLMLLVTGFIIASTIRLALYSQRDELEIMRLVGATERFVQAPCLIEGCLHGLAGALLGTLSLFVLFRVVTNVVPYRDLPLYGITAPHFLSVSSLSIVFICGAAVGIIGSYVAVRRFRDV